MNRACALLLLIGLVASSTSCPGDVTEPPATVLRLLVTAESAEEAVLLRYVETLTGVGIRFSDGYRYGPDTPESLTVRVEEADLGCVECYSIDGSGDQYLLQGDLPLGIQYGLTHLLEVEGFRFFHPERTLAPAAMPLLTEEEATAAGLDGSTVVPEIPVRGLHLHTLHPIEGYYAFWEASRGRADQAKRIMDWVIRQRGNMIQYPALNDVLAGGGTAQLWRAHTQELIEHGHTRGLKMGLGVQLFSASNLQLALNLVDAFGEEDAMEDQMRERLEVVLGPELPFDHLNLSFGEFFGSEPDEFITAVELAYDVAQDVAPGIGMSSVIHVGDDLTVEYEGEELLYYFLVQFADAPILPWVHTTMYYNLFEDAGGAYGHDDFGEHRDFLFERLQAGEPVGYFPESAYWVAYDNPVPVWLPLYVQSRWLDISTIAERTEQLSLPGIDEHVLFSSGWEWGYWQQDVATMRAAHTVPDDWRDSFRWMFAPLGEAGPALAEAVIATTETQHEFLIERRLGAYLGGRDGSMDVAEDFGIVSQPSRIAFDDVLAMDATDRAAFASTTAADMDAFAAALWADFGAIDALGPDLSTLPDGSPNRWYAEVRDGAEVTAQRAAFIAALYRAVLAHGDGDDAARDAAFLEADASYVLARAAVDRRHADLHDAEPELLFTPADNATIYDFGYLLRAETLCYWDRDLASARNQTLGTSDPMPGCALVAR